MGCIKTTTSIRKFQMSVGITLKKVVPNSQISRVGESGTYSLLGEQRERVYEKSRAHAVC